jgi:hypothetical protein
VESGELEHVVVDRAGGDNAALDGQTVADEGHLGDLEVAVVDAEGEDLGAGGQDGEEEVPVWRVLVCISQGGL